MQTVYLHWRWRREPSVRSALSFDCRSAQLASCSTSNYSEHCYYTV